MRVIGTILTIIGTLVALGSFAMKTAVSTTTPDFTTGISTTSDIVNIGLLQQQMMVFQAGCVAAIIGAIFMAAGAFAPSTERLQSEPQRDCDVTPVMAEPMSPVDQVALAATNNADKFIVIAVIAILAVIGLVVFGRLYG